MKSKDPSSRERELKARNLYMLGHSQKHIASIMLVSQQTIVSWKQRYKGTRLDWDKAQTEERETKQTVPQWAEGKIKQCMDRIDGLDADTEGAGPYRKAMQDYINIKKTYEAAIDVFAETARVMESFAGYIKEHYPTLVEELGEVMNAYLRSVGK